MGLVLHVKKALLCILVVALAASVAIVPASADSVLSPHMVHAIIANPVSVFGKTFELHDGNQTYPVYYGFNSTHATVSSILPVPDHMMIQMTIQNVTESDAMWVYIPQSVISADGNNFSLYVDGNPTRYELATYSHSTILGFMVPASAHMVELQGTRVIPELHALPMIGAGFAALVAIGYYSIKRQTGRLAG